MNYDYDPIDAKTHYRHMIKSWRIFAVLDVVIVAFNLLLFAFWLRQGGWFRLMIPLQVLGVILNGREFIKSLDRIDYFKDRLRHEENKAGADN